MRALEGNATAPSGIICLRYSVLEDKDFISAEENQPPRPEEGNLSGENNISYWQEKMRPSWKQEVDRSLLQRVKPEEDEEEKGEEGEEGQGGDEDERGNSFSGK